MFLNKEEEFLYKAEQKHNFEYDYLWVDYIDVKTQVVIYCKKHGKFKQSPSVHLSGAGCPSCGNERSSKNRIKTTSWFKQKASIIK